MKLAPEDCTYYEDAKRWLEDDKFLRESFSSARITAILAVAEYMANQNGETIYIGRVEPI